MPLDPGTRLFSGLEIDQQYGGGSVTVATPLTATTVVFAANQLLLYIQPEGAIAALTVLLPPNPVQGQKAEMSFSQTVTALTVQTSAGGVVQSTSVAAGAALSYRFIGGAWVAFSSTLTPTLARAIPLAPALLHSWVLRSNAPAAAPAAINTFSTQYGLESDYDLVRLVYFSPSATGYTIQRAGISPSSQIVDGHTPNNAAGSSDFTMFQTVFFNNAGADVSPQDQTTYGSGATTFAVPGNAGVLLQAPRYYSDWVRVSSLARIDGGTTPLLLARHLTDALGTYQTNATTAVGYAAISQGRPQTGVFKAGDFVTTPSAMASPSSANDITPYGVQYISRAPGFSVLGVGDSLTQGAGSSSTVHGWGFLSCLALSTPARPISFWCQGYQGSTSNNYWANGYNAFKGCKPQIVTISVWSPNDGLTQAAADAAWSRAMDLADYVRRNGAIPVLMGPCPWSGISTGAQELVRLSARTRMLTAGANGFAVLDWENVIGTGASPNAIQPALLAVDGQHPNDAGNTLMDTQVFRPVLASLIRS